MAHVSHRPICHSLIDVNPSIKEALFYKQPVVALESAIITHGMPIPDNLETALKLEETVAAAGAQPATIAFVRGRIKVGLTRQELETLAFKKEPAIKVSRRDFPAAICRGLSGGTTVAGTMMVAHAVGIKVFATGGIGGVHRGVENTLDVSADLVELGRTPVAVVCSGAKAILDIPRTLEYLETQGVGVVTVGDSDDFPAFYWARSGCKSPYSVASSEEAARFVQAWQKVSRDSGSGLIFAVPVPPHAAGDSQIMEDAIRIALEDAGRTGISGKDTTPFLLGEMNKLTSGLSLKINKALVINNAKTAAEISVQLSKVEATDNPSPSVTVIGGCAVDRVVKVHSSPIVLDSATWPGTITECAGGVGRNLAEAIGCLQRSINVNSKPKFISAVGQDRSGDLILEQTSDVVDTSGVFRSDTSRSAAYEVLLDGNGDCKLVIADDEVLSSISGDWIKRQRLESSRLVVFDANLSIEGMKTTLEICQSSNVPVWFEPTDPRRAEFVVQTNLWKTLSFTSPNLKELRRMAAVAGATIDSSSGDTDILREGSKLAKFLVEQGVANVIVTLGRQGCLIANRNQGDQPFSTFSKQNLSNPVKVRIYPVQTKNLDPVSVSGAGDCFAAALIVAACENWPENVSVAWGMAAANASLLSSKTVPEELKTLAVPQEGASCQELVL
jgi:pseudouridylate synthase / pseudouridine kinase